LPLFYTLTDLEEGKLRDAIFKEAEKTSVNVAQIKVIDGSTRSSHSNAFVTGFGAFRKVVIFDTLIEQQSQDEIIAVVNHELGHVAHHHIIYKIFTSSAQIVGMFALFTLCLGNTDILQSFGFDL
jgi:STE24 endopeptidase